MLMCTVCGEWSPCVGGDRLDICTTCFDMNFASANPPFDLLTGQAARDALEAYVSAPITPRQAQALARMQAYWQRCAEEGTP